MKRTIKDAAEHRFEIFGRPACSVRFTLDCGHVEIRKLSDVPNYVVGSTKIKCRDCFRTTNNEPMKNKPTDNGGTLL